jgi:hypothetical protein
VKEWWLVVILCIQPLLYIQGLTGDFVFDDQFLIVDTMSKLTISDIWMGGLWGSDQNQANFYRPLFSMSIWLDQQLFGFNSIGYHIHSLVWHLVNIVLFARLSKNILSESQSQIATCVFGMHPLMSELVYWISARNDTMALTFVLIFLNVWTRQQSGIGKEREMNWQQVCILSSVFLCGLLSKETALVLFVPVVFEVWKSKNIRLLMSMIAIVAVVFGWRSQIGIAPPKIGYDNVELLLEQSLACITDGIVA